MKMLHFYRSITAHTPALGCFCAKVIISGVCVWGNCGVEVKSYSEGIVGTQCHHLLVPEQQPMCLTRGRVFAAEVSQLCLITPLYYH